MAIGITKPCLSGEELDTETGLYYFGARYYDPRISLWESPDPILDEYLNGERNEGVYNSFNLGLYTYCQENPVDLTDPDGKWTDPLDKSAIRSHMNGRHEPSHNGFGNVRGGNYHGGLDLAAPVGANAKAVGDGKVVGVRGSAHDTKSYGLQVIIETKYNYSLGNKFHDLIRGRFKDFQTKSSMEGKTYFAQYGHLSAADVHVNEAVHEGQVIGQTGTSGNATGLDAIGEQHLHFEMRTSNPAGAYNANSNRVNPAPFFQSLDSNPSDDRQPH